MDFERLKVWQKSMLVCERVHKLYRGSTEFVLKDQIFRSALSIPSNIAEGEERFSAKEAIRFLYIAKGSAGELLTQLILSRRLGLIESDEFKQLEASIREVSKMIAGLIRSKSGTLK
ncbi:four helix bundle protein [Vibrio sp. M260118]|uniref:four helix bundle protein n=1 Tax=Vibrio sp. M260118 TaxID=3020896 RepID=UPI002F4062C4